MLKLLFAVIAFIAAAMIAGVYFHFNPVILIFAALGLRLYGVTRIGGPSLPADVRSLAAAMGSICAARTMRPTTIRRVAAPTRVRATAFAR
jgi:hypothetical protein